MAFAFLLLATCRQTQAQSRVFVSFGGTTSIGGNFSTFFATVPTCWSADVEWDKKIIGSLHVVSGLSTIGVGYSASEDLFTPSDSEYKARYLAVPIMARWNVSNRNFMYVDLGINTLYLAEAHLHESKSKFGTLRDYEGNIAPYLNRFYQSAKFQFTFAVNRFTGSIFMIFQFKGQDTINNLPDHWGLNAQQSTFLNSNGYSDFFLGGFKLGCRIR